MSDNGPDEIEGLYFRKPYLVYFSEISVHYAGADYDIGYAVINVDTGVTEFASPSLPDCISHAAHAAAALTFFKEAVPPEMIDTGMLEEEPSD